MMKLLRILLILILINGCSTPLQKLNKINDKHPIDVAKFCKDKFPCIVKDGDTITKLEYDFIEVACPGQDTIKSTDTLFIPVKSKPKTYIIDKSKFVATPGKTITITKIIRDSASIKLLELSLNDCNDKNNKLNNILLKNDNWIKWLLILLVISILLNILFITNKR